MILKLFVYVSSRISESWTQVGISGSAIASVALQLLPTDLIVQANERHVCICLCCYSMLFKKVFWPLQLCSIVILNMILYMLKIGFFVTSGEVINWAPTSQVLISQWSGRKLQLSNGRWLMSPLEPDLHLRLLTIHSCASTEEVSLKVVVSLYTQNVNFLVIL